MRWWGLAFAAALAGCSQQQSDTMADTVDTFDASSPPSVNPTAAPGVAWRYDTAYRLPDDRIGPVQEEHAATCEALGVARCRITGLSYTVDEQDTVEARLEVKLEPTIAREFGKRATVTVRQADGRLISTELTGEDVATQMTAANDHRRTAATELADVERQLARSDLEDRERTALRERAAELRRALKEARGSIQSGAAQLAVTPMTLRYYGRGGIPGFTENPVRAAWALFVTSAVLLVGFVLKAVAVLLPWGVLLALLIALWRSAPIVSVRRWAWRRRNSFADEPEGP